MARGQASSGGVPHRRPPDPEQDSSHNGTSRNVVHSPENADSERVFLREPPAATPSDESETPAELASRDRVQSTPLSQLSSPQEPRSYAAAVQRGGSTAGVTPTFENSKMLQGISDPQGLAKLEATLRKDWSSLHQPPLTSEQAELTKIALTSTNVDSDANLRIRTAKETDALLAYLRGEIELPHPPKFIKATMFVLERAMMEEFHATHIEAALTAQVSPHVRLRRNMHPLALFALLFISNTDADHGRQMLDRMMHDVKSLSFDGIHTLRFVFPSRRVANFYLGMNLRLQRSVIELEDTDRTACQPDGMYKPAQLSQLYSIMVTGAHEMGIVALTNAFSKLTGVAVVDTERIRATNSSVTDVRSFVIRFDQERCPEELQSVTKVLFGSVAVILHHYQIFSRSPCQRCCSARHTTGYCRVKQDQLQAAQLRGTRHFTGKIASFEVGSITTYCHSDGGSLDSFLTTLTTELEQSTESPQDDTVSPHALFAPPYRQSTPSRDESTAPVEDSEPTQEEAPATTPDDGYQIVLGKAAGKAAKKRVKPPSKSAAAPTTTKEPIRQNSGVRKSCNPPPKAQQSGSQRKVLPHGNNSAGRAPPSEFAVFQQEMLRGQFDVLREDDDDDEADSSSINSSSSVNEEAPYAYPDDDSTPGHDNSTAPSSSGSSYVGPSTPTSTPPPASFPGSEIPYSLASSISSPALGISPAPSPSSLEFGLAQDTDREMDHSITPLPDNLSGGFEMGETKAASTMPQHLQSYLCGLQAQQISVPANGQCAYAAFFASTTNHIAGPLRFDAQTVREANGLKRKIYTLILANLYDDVAAGVVDPIREICRLFPGQAPPATKAEATASLFRHYTEERARSVNTSVPTSFWAGSEVLRAMAQHLREPLFVIDVDSRDVAHVQRYYYRDYVLPNGKEHETGCGGPIPDKEAQALLAHYARLHILPTLMILNRTENHFYGVGHHVDTFLRWHAEGDPSYVENIAEPHDWLSEINIIPEGEPSALTEMMIDTLEDCPVVNTAIICRVPMRQRLDILYERLGITKLDDAEYDQAALDKIVKATARRISQTAPVPDLTSSNATLTLAPSVSFRHHVSSKGRVAMEVYTRLLQSIQMDPELLTDRSKLRQLRQENSDAYIAWRDKNRHWYKLPAHLLAARDLSEVFPWFLAHREALHQIFTQLPYPELIAKALPVKLLIQWGQLEVYDVQASLIHSLAEREDLPKHTLDFCQAWATSCPINPDTLPEPNLASKADRWRRLTSLLPQTPDLGCPSDIPPTHWHLLHILPWVTWSWPDKQLDGAKTADHVARYRQDDLICKFFKRIEQSSDWSAALNLLLPFRWEDRMATLVAIGSTQPEY